MNNLPKIIDPTEHLKNPRIAAAFEEVRQAFASKGYDPDAPLMVFERDRQTKEIWAVTGQYHGLQYCAPLK